MVAKYAGKYWQTQLTTTKNIVISSCKPFWWWLKKSFDKLQAKPKKDLNKF